MFSSLSLYTNKYGMYCSPFVMGLNIHASPLTMTVNSLKLNIQLPLISWFRRFATSLYSLYFRTNMSGLPSIGIPYIPVIANYPVCLIEMNLIDKPALLLCFTNTNSFKLTPFVSSKSRIFYLCILLTYNISIPFTTTKDTYISVDDDQSKLLWF